MMPKTAALLFADPKRPGRVGAPTAPLAVAEPGAGLPDVPANVSARPSSAPAKTGKRPFQLVALADVSVCSGVMRGDDLQEAEDFVMGDDFAFDTLSNSTPADCLFADGRMHVTLPRNAQVGATTLAVSDHCDLVLMSQDADMLHCQYLSCQTSDCQQKGFLLMPSGFDASKVYELISMAG